MPDSLSYKNKHILLVDDDKTTLLFIEQILKSAGYTSIHLAQSAKEAYTILWETKVDLIVLFTYFSSLPIKVGT